MRARCVIAVTTGDPCGIGPEVLLKALRTWSPPGSVRLVLIGHRSVFDQTARRLRRPLPSWPLVSCESVRTETRPVSLLECGAAVRDRPGYPTVHASRAALTYLRQAVALWRSGQVDALVTGPVTKWALARLEPGFVGQTEFLARAMEARAVLMMFVSDRLRVALLTRHVLLRDVSRSLTPQMARQGVKLAASALRVRFGIRQPRLVLCGLNPHAGEASRDSEEARIFRPALQALRREGLQCDGPVAADGFFAQDFCRYDAVVCGYHDQGLIPFKLLARDRGCQLSVGLPIVRTAPDHGSALDLAGRGLANAGSMRYAIRLAADLCLRSLHDSSTVRSS
jgi:4-hydroxythreonine-4-phosphate dehydrogenase